MSLRLVTLDPGESTGYAVFLDGKQKASGTEKMDGLERLLKNLTASNADLVVAERVIPYGLGKTSLNITSVMHDINKTFYYHPGFHWIKASQWKPLISRNERVTLSDERKERTQRVLTQHESDALCIGLYVLKYRKDWIKKVEASRAG